MRALPRPARREPSDQLTGGRSMTEHEQTRPDPSTEPATTPPGNGSAESADASVASADASPERHPAGAAPGASAAASADASPEGHPGGTAPSTAPAREWLAQLQQMIENFATQAGPVAREVGAKAAELAALAAEKAGPIAARAAEVTADAGTRFAERSRTLATELRRELEDLVDGDDDKGAKESVGTAPAGSEPTTSEAAPPTTSEAAPPTTSEAAPPKPAGTAG
jgi:hypothetical protein